MKTRAAVLWGHDQKWKIEEIDLGDPGPNEVLVKTAFAGLCHSDEHLVTGDIAVPDEVVKAVGAPHFLPVIGGHEGSGVIVEVGSAVTSVQPGDHISVSFIPSCGTCHWCSTGRQNLCDMGAGTLAGGMLSDGKYRHHSADGTPP